MTASREKPVIHTFEVPLPFHLPPISLLPGREIHKSLLTSWRLVLKCPSRCLIFTVFNFQSVSSKVRLELNPGRKVRK